MSTRGPIQGASRKDSPGSTVSGRVKGGLLGVAALLLAGAAALWARSPLGQGSPEAPSQTAPDKQELLEHLQRLQHRVTELEARQGQRPSAAPVGGSSAVEPVPEDEESTDEKKAVPSIPDPGLALQQMQARDERLMNDHERRFSEDLMDTKWSREKVRHLNHAFEDLEGSTLAEVECRSTMCKMRIAHSTEAPRNEEAFRRHLIESVPEGMGMWGKNLGGEDVVFLFTPDPSPPWLGSAKRGGMPSQHP